MVAIKCPNCSQEYECSIENIGQEAECQRCKQTFVISQSSSVPLAKEQKIVEDYNKTRTKKCPFCTEEIKIEAVKCKFCGEYLSNVINKTSNGKSQLEIIVNSTGCNVEKLIEIIRKTGTKGDTEIREMVKNNSFTIFCDSDLEAKNIVHEFRSIGATAVCPTNRAVEKENTNNIQSNSTEIIGIKTPVKAMYLCLLIGWAIFFLPIPFTSIFGWVLVFSTFILSIVCLSKGKVSNGVFGLILSIIISPVVYWISFLVLGLSILSAVSSITNPVNSYQKNSILKDYTAECELRDRALHDLTLNLADDSSNSGLYVTAKWTSEIKQPDRSSVAMDVIISQEESAKGKVVIANASMKGIVAQGTNNGSLTCHIKQSDITADRPYVWVKISLTIDGQVQHPIIKSLGKFNR